MSADVQIVDAGAAEQARRVRAGELSVRELIAATLARIAALDPRLTAYRVVFAERALAAADELDRRRNADRALPLLGVPVAVKDDMDVEGEVTAWGTDAYGPPKSADSEVVTRLRAAGAIVIGKTLVPEMTLWPWTASTTWGVTRNPWDAERTPGGSSGGSAVAAATGMCGIAMGSDGGGSIRYPAALTGVFGLKPQQDRISLKPDHVDGWNGLIAYGPLARTVRDAALLLDAVADEVPRTGVCAAIDAPFEALRIAVSLNAPPGHVRTPHRRAPRRNRANGRPASIPRPRRLRARGRLWARRDLELYGALPQGCASRRWFDASARPPRAQQSARGRARRSTAPPLARESSRLGEQGRGSHEQRVRARRRRHHPRRRRRSAAHRRCCRSWRCPVAPPIECNGVDCTRECHWPARSIRPGRL
jgi:Asp-tRNA(Asn)/Glu-tRNA(Gln) amidotransferase A subunit family amidase